jgi:hypothetical protein
MYIITFNHYYIYIITFNRYYTYVHFLVPVLYTFEKVTYHVSNDAVCLLFSATQILNIIQVLFLVLGEAEDEVLRCKSNNSKYGTLLCGDNV